MTDSRHTCNRRAFVAGALATAALSPRAAAAAMQPDDIDVSSRIEPLLAACPPREDGAVGMIPFYYADLGGQLASVGTATPDPDGPTTAVPQGFYEVIAALPLASRAYEVGTAEDWFPSFGFNPFAVGQAMFLPASAGVVSLFRGGFDRATVEVALVASGYQEVLQETGGSYLSLGDDPALDTPAGRLGLGTMNHAMVHADVLVFAQQEADLQAASQVVAGLGPSMLDQPPWSGMVERMPADTVGTIPLAPAALRLASTPATPAATPVGVDGGGIRFLAFGVRSGSRSAPLALGGNGTPAATPVGASAGVAARIEGRIQYDSQSRAELEAVAIPERWADSASVITGQPLDALMRLESARQSTEDPLVVELSFVSDVPNRWIQMIHTRDLAPLLPPEE